MDNTNMINLASDEDNITLTACVNKINNILNDRRAGLIEKQRLLFQLMEYYHRFNMLETLCAALITTACKDEIDKTIKEVLR